MFSIDGIVTGISAVRLLEYRQQDGSVYGAVAQYSRNLALCEALYPSLHFLEIGLRNAIHVELSALSQGRYWYDDLCVTSPIQHEAIIRARGRLCGAGKEVTADRLIAELSLGFWTAFFNKAHARTGIGDRLPRAVFSNAPRRLRNRREIDRRLSRIRILRNRVFHHERIVHFTDLSQRYDELRETLDWISTSLSTLCCKYDRFGRVFALEPEHWHRQEMPHAAQI